MPDESNPSPPRVSSTASRTSGTTLLLAGVLLVNSAAVAYGFHVLAGLKETMQYVMLVTIPGRTAAASQASSEIPRPPVDLKVVHVDLYSDFACPFCRASAHTVDSLRKAFGQRVQWQYLGLPNRDQLAFRSALIAVCVSDSGGPWRLYRLLNDSSSWSRQALDRAVAKLAINRDSLARCVASQTTESRVWAELFTASRQGVIATPTVIVDGVRVVGRITGPALGALIEASARKRAEAIGRTTGDSGRVKKAL